MLAWHLLNAATRYVCSLILLICCTGLRLLAWQLPPCVVTALNAAAASHPLSPESEAASAASAAAVPQPLLAHLPGALPLSPPPTLLPPLLPHHSGRLTVVLDLDDTLLSMFPSAAAPPAALASTMPRRTCESTSQGGAGGNVMLVFERPGVREFLSGLAAFAEVVLFTAGTPERAQPLVDWLDPTGHLFSARLYRNACCVPPSHILSRRRTSSSTGGALSSPARSPSSASSASAFVKDLSRLGRDLARTVLVDDRAWPFVLQPNSGVPIRPFKGDPQDSELLDVVLPLLRSLAFFPDVRPVLEARFQMVAWFAARGISAGQ